MSAFQGKIRNKSAARKNALAYKNIKQLLENQAKESSEFYLENITNGKINKSIDGDKSNKED